MGLVASGSGPHRYEQVASHVRHLIESGTYSSQEKLPSVRSLSGQLQVSITTVLEAYRMLEDQGSAGGQTAVGLLRKLPDPAAAPCDWPYSWKTRLTLAWESS